MAGGGDSMHVNLYPTEVAIQIKLYKNTIL